MIRKIAVVIAFFATTIITANTASAEEPAPPTTDKVITFVVENKGFTQMQAGAPRIWALGQQYGLADNFYAIRHPSWPNYVAMAAGSTLGRTSNSYKTLSGPTVFGNAWKNGRSAKVIMDGMFTDRCRQSNYRKYVVRHNPWAFAKDERALCEKYNFDFKYFAGDVAAAKLANVEMVIPNNCNNAHDCSIATADKWIKARIDTLMAGPDWNAGRLTIIVTADEDNGEEDNRILTVVIHPSLNNKVVSTRLDLYSLSRLMSDFGHSPHLNNAATAPDMAAAFGLVIN